MDQEFYKRRPSQDVVSQKLKQTVKSVYVKFCPQFDQPGRPNYYY